MFFFIKSAKKLFSFVFIKIKIIIVFAKGDGKCDCGQKLE